jgi:hypothetical protein
MRGLAGHPADNDRHQGVLKALGENPGIKLLPNNEGVATGWDPDTGTKLITDLINSGGYDDVDGIWTSGIDQQVVDAIKAAGKEFVPIVGADLKGFVEMLLNKNGGYDGLKGDRRRGPDPCAEGAQRRADRLADEDGQGFAGQRRPDPGHLPARTGVLRQHDGRRQGQAAGDRRRRPEQPVAGQLVHQRLDRLHHRPDAGLQGTGRIAHPTASQRAGGGRSASRSLVIDNRGP